MKFIIENEDGSPARRLVTDAPVMWSEDLYCPPSQLSEEERVLYRVFEFQDAQIPQLTCWQCLRELDPIKVEGVWQQQWEVIDSGVSHEDKIKYYVNEIDKIATKVRNLIVADISPGEMAAWPIKRTEALAYGVDPSEASAPGLAIEAARGDIPLADLVAKVLFKADLFIQLESDVAGRCRALQNAVKTTTTVEELLAIDLNSGWPNIPNS